ncbi:MAG TPA: PhoU domain-containing protein [Euzebyales bacterium]
MPRRRDSLDRVLAGFIVMLHEAREALTTALAARLGEIDPATAHGRVATLEERADAAEISMRRQLLIHATVHGAGDMPACLTYMSIAKDAERITDLALGLSGLAALITPPTGSVRDDLAQLGGAVVAVLEELPTVIEHEDVDGARDLIKRARAAQQACLARLDDVVRSESETGVPHATGDTAPGRWDSSTQPVALALTYRHLGRIAANALNIASSVVVPLDRLDYPSTLE